MGSTAPAPPSRPPRRHGVPLAVLTALAVAVALAAWKFWPRGGGPRPIDPEDPPSPLADPRLTYPTPYRNVRPEVQYVGDAACATCHADVAKAYAGHAMARALAPAATATAIERYGEKARNPFDVAGFRYRVERQGSRAWHKEALLDGRGRAVAETAAEVRFAVGSGHSGRAYLIDRGGYLFSSPITWYPTKEIWDLSPGYEKSNPHFDRPVTPDCLFCHSNYADHVGDTLNRYREPIFRGDGIGCERCHGPGELHVKRHADGEAFAQPDDTIVNPAKLEPALREAVCQQCHLQGKQRVWRRGRDTFDYRPGLPFHLFMTEFVQPVQEGGTLKFVGTVEQMYASRCFQKGAGKEKMGCISCHDPHSLPAADKKVAFYRQRCLGCHHDKGCSLPEAARREKDDSCVACHMPKTGSTVNHTAISDHRIPRVAGAAGAADKGAAAAPALPVHFHRDLVRGADPGISRDLGIALVKIADNLPDDAGRALTGRAVPLLESALRRDGGDLDALEAQGSALWFQGRLEDAFASFEELLRAAPRRENALFLSAALALRLRRPDLARDRAGEAIKVNPWRWRYHLTLAQALGQSDDWKAALEAVREALKLNPADLAARQLLVLCHLRLGEVTRAERELDAMLSLNPPRPEALRGWFDQELRRAGGRR